MLHNAYSVQNYLPSWGPVSFSWWTLFQSCLQKALPNTHG